MFLKDHYATLELDSAAGIPEIKKAYRRLALQYHPDKKPGDAYAAAQFAAVKEAYEVLTDPSKKDKYLQQRWYDQSIGRKRKEPIITPVNLLKQVIELEKYVSRLDVFRMDTLGLYEYINAVLDDSTINQLNSFNEKDVNDRIVSLLMDCLKLLPLSIVQSLETRIKKIDMSTAMQATLHQFVASRVRAHKRDRYKIWVIILAVLLLCLLIIFLS